MFLRELKVLVHQLLGSDLTEDFLTLVTHLAVTQCKKVRVCDEDDDLSLYLLEALVTGSIEHFSLSLVDDDGMSVFF